ncbi:LOW QUALITY PROTEIN: hypothetical protein NC652_018575 [Populus alba x Populus x berolinensis]|nr:LOW QUALITY PROTEIN: hypothetical protein NC652_018575 [Populus alba x Populus x berolinensis]
MVPSCSAPSGVLSQPQNLKNCTYNSDSRTSNPKGEDIIPSSLFSNGADDLHTTDEALDGEERIQQ